MTKIVPTHYVGKKILEALKLDLKFVTRITLDFDVNSAVMCTVEFYPDLNQVDATAQALETEMKRYVLIELQQSNDAP